MPVVVRTARCSRWDASRSGTRVGAVLALIAMSVVLVASLMVGAPRAGAATDDCARPPSGSIRVVMVVDAGGGSPIVTCLVVPDGITGSKLLAARAAQLGVAPPSYAGSGLLCTIDGAPASGCAETSAGSYWANFSGTSGTWVYSSYNPFIRHLRDGDIEGWRYVVHGSGVAGDSVPGIAPSASLFPAVIEVSVRPAPSDASASAAGTTGAPTEPTSSGSSDPTAVGPEAGDTAAVDGISGPSAAVRAPGGAVMPGSVETERLAANELASAATSNGSSGLPWLAPLVAILAIAGLGLGAVLRSRARS